MNEAEALALLEAKVAHAEKCGFGHDSSLLESFVSVGMMRTLLNAVKRNVAEINPNERGSRATCEHSKIVSEAWGHIREHDALKQKLRELVSNHEPRCICPLRKDIERLLSPQADETEVRT